jgi:hypothetical protein
VTVDAHCRSTGQTGRTERTNWNKNDQSKSTVTKMRHVTATWQRQCWLALSESERERKGAKREAVRASAFLLALVVEEGGLALSNALAVRGNV